MSYIKSQSKNLFSRGLWSRIDAQKNVTHIKYCKHVMSHINESCHTWTRHFPYQRVISLTNQPVMSHINESCHLSTSRATHQRVMSHINESCHTWTRHFPYAFPLSTSYLPYQPVMSYINESCHTSTDYVIHQWGIPFSRCVSFTAYRCVEQCAMRVTFSKYESRTTSLLFSRCFFHCLSMRRTMCDASHIFPQYESRTTSYSIL